MAQDQGWDFDGLLDRIWFDTCFHHQRGIDVAPTDNILFASEMVGAVRGIDPATVRHDDDTKPYIDNSSLDDAAKQQVVDTNIRRVLPPLGAAMNPNARNRHVVVRTIERAAPDIIDALAPIGTASVHEAIGRRGYVGPDLTPIQQGTRIAGSAVTVLSHPGDNVMIHAAVEVCEPGDVLVVAYTAPSSHGGFGDLLATSLMARGVVGLVVDAGVRDTADLRDMGFPVWSRHVSCQGCVKATPGSVNVPIAIGGITVHPGDVVCADDDGVVIVPRPEAEWGLAQSQARLAKESATRARLEAGELGLDFYGLRDQLTAMGVEWIDSAADLV